jgi:transcriptional regulator with XRE-family HTH domain
MISKYEHGTRTPTMQTLDQLAEAVGVSSKKLLRRTP